MCIRLYSLYLAWSDGYLTAVLEAPCSCFGRRDESDISGSYHAWAERLFSIFSKGSDRWKSLG